MPHTPPPLPPRPVQSLAYDSPPCADPLAHLLRGVGLLLAVLGAVQALANATGLLASLGNWGDPFYWRIRRTNPIPSLPSSLALTLVAVGLFASGGLALAGGLAALARRPWARNVLAAYALAEIAVRTANTVARMWPMLQRGLAPDALLSTVSYLAALLTTIAAPVIVLLLVQRRESWPALAPAAADRGAYGG